MGIMKGAALLAFAMVYWVHLTDCAVTGDDEEFQRKAPPFVPPCSSVKNPWIQCAVNFPPFEMPKPAGTSGTEKLNGDIVHSSKQHRKVGIPCSKALPFTRCYHTDIREEQGDTKQAVAPPSRYRLRGTPTKS